MTLIEKSQRDVRFGKQRPAVEQPAREPFAQFNAAAEAAVPVTIYVVSGRESGLKRTAVIYDNRADGIDGRSNTPSEAIADFVKCSQREIARLIGQLAEAQRNMDAARKLTIADFVVQHSKY